MPAGYHLRITVSKPTTTPSTSSSYQRSHLDAPALVPSSIFASLPADPPKTTGRRYTLHHPKQPVRLSEQSTSSSNPQQDYRFGPIRLDWVDFDNMDPSGGSQNAWKDKAQGSKSGPATAQFVPLRTKSGSTNLPEGVVHIYRQVSKQERSGGETEAQASKSVDTEDTKPDASDSDGVMMGVLAVPAWMTPSDFLAFVAPAADGMAHLRMIRDSAPNRSIVVIKFRKSEDATEFAEAYNGKQFNAMEAEICHVVRILSVEIETTDSVSQAISRISAPDATYELPTCPVCLERMDSAVTGLVTVPCSHTFHCACLSKWGDSRCPVCRYSQTLLTSHPTSANTSRSNVPIPFTSVSPTSQCADCASDSPSTSNLWICLVCGNLGCGRYRRAHAQAHYEATTHLYALELDTQRVWDYAGDGYVHRLIQNKADGKLVELPSASRHAGGPAGPSDADALGAEKIEAIGIEYSYLLSSQLDSQRAFYEAQLVDLRTRLERLEAALTAQDARRRDEDDARAAEVERDRKKAEQAVAVARQKEEKAAALARAREKELQEERAVTAGLMKNLAVTRERADAAEKEKEGLQARIGELEEEVRDIMFFVEARDTVAGGEAAGGSLEVRAKPEPAGGGKRRKAKKG